MRGKAYAIAVMTAVLGITPAYAGKRTDGRLQMLDD